MLFVHGQHLASFPFFHDQAINSLEADQTYLYKCSMATLATLLLTREQLNSVPKSRCNSSSCIIRRIMSWGKLSRDILAESREQLKSRCQEGSDEEKNRMQSDTRRCNVQR